MLLLTDILKNLTWSYFFYASLNQIEAMEASEYDTRTHNQSLMFLGKILILSASLTLVFSPVHIAILLVPYVVHARMLQKFDSSVPNVYYSRMIKTRWNMYRILVSFCLLSNYLPSSLVMATLAAPTFVGVAQIALLMLIITMPFVFHYFRLSVVPNNQFLKALHRLDEKFGVWAQLLSVLVRPDSFVMKLIHFVPILPQFLQVIGNVYTSIKKMLLSNFFLKPLNFIFRSSIMPDVIKNSYNNTLGRLYDEITALDEYNASQKLDAQDIKEIIDNNNIYTLKPSVESLYTQADSKSVNSSPRPLDAQHSIRSFYCLLEQVTSDSQNFRSFLEQLSSVIPAYKKQLVAALNIDDSVQVLNFDFNTTENLRVDLRQRLGLKDDQQHSADEHDVSQDYIELLNNLTQNIKTVIDVINNPIRQSASTAIKAEDITGLLHVFFDRVMLHIDKPEKMRSNAEIVSHLMDTMLRCQDSLHTYLSDEILKPNPNINQLREIISSDLLAVQRRETYRRYRDAYINELRNAAYSESFLNVVRDLFANPDDIEHQQQINLYFLGCKKYYSGTQPDRFELLSEQILERHSNFTDLITGRFILTYSLSNTLYLSSYFTASSVESMILYTQNVYADCSDKENLPWLNKWHQAWANYLEQNYGADHDIDPQLHVNCEAAVRCFNELEQQEHKILADIDHGEPSNVAIGDQRFAMLANEPAIQQHLPEDFHSMSLFQKREYFYLNNPMVRGADLFADNPYDNKELNDMCEKKYVSREFAVVVLFSEGLISKPTTLHDKLSELPGLTRVRTSPELLVEKGYMK